MTINKTDITPTNSIDDAKKLKYGTTQRDLTTEEKKIFESSFLKDTSDSPDLVKIQETAFILEKVIDAAALDSFNQTVFNELTAFKSSSNPKNYAYKAINSNGNQFDNAIKHLETKKPGYVPPNNEDSDKKIAAWEAQIIGIRAEIDARNKKMEIPEAAYAQVMVEKEEMKRKIKKIESLILRLKTGVDTTAAQIVHDDDGNPHTVAPILVGGVNVNKMLEKRVAFLRDESQAWNKIPRFYKTNFKDYTFNGKKYISKAQLDYLDNQIAEYIREIDDTKMKAAITANLSGADQIKALSDWKHISSGNFTFNAREEDPLKISSYKSREVDTEKDKNGNLMFKSRGKIGQIKDSEWPINTFDHRIFFSFMEKVFPKSDLTDGKISNAITTALDYKKDSEFDIKLLKKDPNPKLPPSLITDGRHSKAPVSLTYKLLKEKNEFIDDDDYKEQNRYNLIKLSDLGQVAGFWWEAYGNDTSLVSTSGVINTTEFYSKHLSLDDLYHMNYLTMVEWIKVIRGTNEFPETLISDDVLLKIVQESTEGLYNFQRRNKLKTTSSKRRPNDLAVDKSKVVMNYEHNNLDPNASDYTKYLWLQPLRDEITKLNLEVYKAEHRAKAKMKSVGIIEREKVDFEQQISDLETRIEAERKVRDETKGLDIPSLEAKFEAAYQVGKKYTNAEIIALEHYYNVLKKKCDESNKTVKQSIKDAKKEADDRLYSDTVNKAESRISTLNGSLVGPQKDKIKDLSSDELVSYQADFNTIEAVRTLEQSEINLKTAIQNKIDGKEDEDKEDETKLSKKELAEVFGLTENDIEDTLITNWTSFASGKFKAKDKIQAIIDRVASKKTAFFETLKKSIVGKTDKTTEDEAWKEFVKKEPEIILKLIIEHELTEGSKKDDTINTMKDERKEEKAVTVGDKKQVLADEYFDGEEPKPEKIIQYLYETEIGESHKMKDVQKEDEKNEDEKDETKESSWFKFRSDNVWRPLLTYGGGLILILAVVGAVFWKNIAEWWNGPAEEEGEIGEDEKSEDDNE